MKLLPRKFCDFQGEKTYISEICHSGGKGCQACKEINIFSRPVCQCTLNDMVILLSHTLYHRNLLQINSAYVKYKCVKLIPRTEYIIKILELVPNWLLQIHSPWKNQNQAQPFTGNEVQPLNMMGRPYLCGCTEVYEVVPGWLSHRDPSPCVVKSHHLPFHLFFPPVPVIYVQFSWNIFQTLKCAFIEANQKLLRWPLTGCHPLIHAGGANAWTSRAFSFKM